MYRKREKKTVYILLYISHYTKTNRNCIICIQNINLVPNFIQLDSVKIINKCYKETHRDNVTIVIDITEVLKEELSLSKGYDKSILGHTLHP